MMAEDEDSYVLLPDQMYGAVVNNNDSDNDVDNDCHDDDDLSSDQYLREMEVILRKIRRREVRKKVWSKHQYHIRGQYIRSYL